VLWPSLPRGSTSSPGRCLLMFDMRSHHVTLLLIKIVTRCSVKGG